MAVTKLNKSCIVCSKKYSFCTGCSDYDHLPRWMAIFHDANCKEIYNATSMYGQIPNEEIKERLDKCDLSNKVNFHKNIQKIIDEIYAVDIVELVEGETPVASEEFVEVMTETLNDSDIEQIEINEVVETTTDAKSVQTYNYKKKKKR